MKWRLKGRFWMARLAFLAVCAFVVASTVNLWVGYKIENSLKAPPPYKALPQITIKKPRERNFTALNDRNIFGAKREQVTFVELEGAEGIAGRWEEAVPSGLPARLI